MNKQRDINWFRNKTVKLAHAVEYKSAIAICGFKFWQASKDESAPKCKLCLRKLV